MNNILFKLLRKSSYLVPDKNTDLHRKTIIDLKYHISKIDDNLLRLITCMAKEPNRFKVCEPTADPRNNDCYSKTKYTYKGESIGNFHGVNECYVIDDTSNGKFFVLIDGKILMKDIVLFEGSYNCNLLELAISSLVDLHIREEQISKETLLAEQRRDIFSDY